MACRSSKVADAVIRLLWLGIAYLGVCALTDYANNGRFTPVAVVRGGDGMLVFDSRGGEPLVVPMPPIHNDKDFAPGSH